MQRSKPAPTVVFREARDDHLRVALGPQGAALQQRLAEVDAARVDVQPAARCRAGRAGKAGGQNQTRNKHTCGSRSAYQCNAPLPCFAASRSPALSAPPRPPPPGTRVSCAPSAADLALTLSRALTTTSNPSQKPSLNTASAGTQRASQRQVGHGRQVGWDGVLSAGEVQHCQQLDRQQPLPLIHFTSRQRTVQRRQHHHHHAPAHPPVSGDDTRFCTAMLCSGPAQHPPTT